MMQELVLSIFALAALMMVWPLSAFGSGGKEISPRKAILLVAFGTSVPKAQKAYDQIDAQARKAFPEVEIRWAYTSKTIRARLSSKGRPVSSPEVALAQMMDEGFTEVAILSLHVIPGKEFHDLYRNAELYGRMTGGFKHIVVARPLLSSHDDMAKVAKALLQRIPPERRPEDGVIFIGHGSQKHPADAVYAAMNHVFQDLASNVFVGAVQGYPSSDNMLPKLTEKGIKKVYLIPFMAVAGDHAHKDMAGDQPDSWKSVLNKNGMECEPIQVGIAEHPEVVDVWLDHLRDVFSQL
jgi:sirohydrochlorin cobaltochelatase